MNTIDTPGSEQNSFLKKPSLLVILFTICFAFWFNDYWRPYNPERYESSFHYDVFNYYSYLPAIVFNNGSFEFERFIPSNYNPKGPKGTYLPKVTYGMALLYSPFFLVAWKIAYNSQTPLNGFTEEFVYCIRAGSIFYVILGLFYLRKLLLLFFNERITALALLAALYGTMLFMYTFVFSEMSHGYLFTLMSMFLYYTHRWHETRKWSYTVLVGIVLGLMVLIRPTELLMALFFIFWNVRSSADIRRNLKLILKEWPKILLLVLIMLLLWIPQFLFWKIHTGSYIYFSYPGERFYWQDPQIMNVLFSYRKGWLIYTPMILFSIAGMFSIRRNFPLSGNFLFLFTSILVYVLSCWWDWFFGGCFGARGFSQHIAYLSLPLALFLERSLFPPKAHLISSSLSLGVCLLLFSFISLNIVQSIQYNHKLIHPNAMSEKNYWRVFRKFNFEDSIQLKLSKHSNFPDYKKLLRGEDRDK